MSVNEEFVFDETEVIKRAVREGACAEEEADLFLTREFEYLAAKGLIADAPPETEETDEPVCLNDDEQFLFFHKTTGLSAEKITALMRIERKIMLEGGIIDYASEEDILNEVTFTEQDVPCLEEIYDFAYIMKSISYMYRNGIILDRNIATAEEWDARARREGWDDTKPFVYMERAPLPLRKSE